MDSSTDLDRHRQALARCAAGMCTAAHAAQTCRERGDEDGVHRMHFAMQKFDFALVVEIYRYLRALGAS